jgi:MraZ protein
VFLGESTHTLDAKSRIVVPKRFLLEFPEDQEGRRSAMLTRGFEGCLFLFPEQGFAKALERMQLQAFGGAELRKMQRLFFSNAHQTQIDGAGRMVVPEKLRALAELSRDVVLVGCADRAEIWSAEAWEKFNAEHDEEFDRLDSVMLGDGAARGGGGGED